MPPTHTYSYIYLAVCLIYVVFIHQTIVKWILFATNWVPFGQYHKMPPTEAYFLYTGRGPLREIRQETTRIDVDRACCVSKGVLMVCLLAVWSADVVFIITWMQFPVRSTHMYIVNTWMQNCKNCCLASCWRYVCAFRFVLCVDVLLDFSVPRKIKVFRRSDSRDNTTREFWL